MVGVCIKYMHENYGGILQAYATVSYLENQNIEYELVRYTRKKTVTEALKDVPRLFNAVWFNSRYEGIQRKLSLKKHPEYAKNNQIRMKAFAGFKKRAFKDFSDEYVGYAALREGGKKYSAVITGSDQLWSPAGLPTNYYNLMFVPDDTLKISIASSFGVKEIPWYQRKRTVQYLNRIEYISMRENRGSEIVKELTGRDVPTILDPVFFLSKNEWLERIPNKREINEPYIFAYFLGATQEYRNAVKKLAHDKGMKVVALRHMDQYVEEDENFGDFAPYDVSPERFLNLLRNAEYRIADRYELYATNLEKAIELDGTMICHSAEPHPRRDEYYLNLDKETLRAHIQKFVPIRIRDYLIEKSKGIFYRMGVYKFLKNKK